MPKNRIHQDAPLSNAEKQRRYRERQKAALEKLQVANTDSTLDHAAIRLAIKADLIKSWVPEVKQARLEAERKKGRELAKRSDKSHERGRTIGLCEAAAFFIGKDRPDIAQHLLAHFMVDKDKAAAALEADKRTRSTTLATLTKARAWKKPTATLW